MHDDPSGKSKLKHAIQTVNSKYKTQPEFMAFEWAQATYAALAPRRSELAKRLSPTENESGKGFSDLFAIPLVTSLIFRMK